MYVEGGACHTGHVEAGGQTAELALSLHRVGFADQIQVVILGGKRPHLPSHLAGP